MLCMWIVGTHEDSFFSIHKTKEDALRDYEERKEFYSPVGDEIIDIESRVILAKVEKYVRYVDTGKPVIDVDDNGEEFERDDLTYADFKEANY